MRGLRAWLIGIAAAQLLGVGVYTVVWAQPAPRRTASETAQDLAAANARIAAVEATAGDVRVDVATIKTRLDNIERIGYAVIIATIVQLIAGSGFAYRRTGRKAT